MLFHWVMYDFLKTSDYTNISLRFLQTILAIENHLTSDKGRPISRSLTKANRDVVLIEDVWLVHPDELVMLLRSKLHYHPNDEPLFYTRPRAIMCGGSGAGTEMRHLEGQPQFFQFVRKQTLPLIQRLLQDNIKLEDVEKTLENYRDFKPEAVQEKKQEKKDACRVM